MYGIDFDTSQKSLSDELLKIFMYVIIISFFLIPSHITLSRPFINSKILANSFLQKVNLIQNKPAPQHIVTVPVYHFLRLSYARRITAYNDVPNQTSSHPQMSACGPTLQANQIALSQNLFFKPDGQTRCGEHIQIRLNNGHYINGIVWDTMNARYHNAADILIRGTDQYQKAISFGIESGNIYRIITQYKHMTLSKYLNI